MHGAANDFVVVDHRRPFLEGPPVARAERLEVKFGRVARPERREAIEAAGRRFDGWWVVAGVPHYVVEVEDVANVPIAEWAPELRRHPAWGPPGANVDFLGAASGGRVA